MWIPRPPLVPYGLRDIVKNFLPDDQIEDFAAWAFGPEYEEFGEVIEFAQAWNRNHQDLFTIDVSSTIVDDVAKMTTYFKNRDEDE